ncbi:MAG: ankyrin repeat domain-containing protein [Candidatus Babeliaceae bacterium]|jgi:hypothetical protein
MKSIIALHALVCIFMLPISAMEEGSELVAQHNYFDVLPNEVMVNIMDKFIDGCLFSHIWLLISRRSVLLTCKRFNEIGEPAFINYLFKKYCLGYSNTDSKIHIAASLNSITWLKNFFKDNDNYKHLIHGKNSTGLTPLHCAANAGAHDAAQLLIEMKASVDAQDLKNQTPLHYAVICNRLRMSQLLLDSGANTTIPWNEHNYIHTAVFFENTSMVKLLLGHGVSIGSRPNDVDGVLSHAKQWGNPEIITLIERELAKKTGI